MRAPVLLLGGVVLVGAGIGLSEWARRHPPERKTEETEAKAEPAPKPKKTLSPDELLKAEPGESEPRDLELLQQGQAKLDKAEQVTTDFTVALGILPTRMLASSGPVVLAVVDHDAKGSAQSVVRLDGRARLVTARRGLSAVSVLGELALWGERGGIYAQPAVQDEKPRAVVRFPNARVTALAASGDTVVAALVPQDFDPFSTDPEAALVAVSLSGGAPRTLATKLVRLGEVATDGESAFFIAGYPATLQKVSLEGGAAPSELAARADGPLLVKDGQLFFKDPSVTSPGVQKVSIAGGAPALVSKGEVDRFTLEGGQLVTAFGTTLTRQGGKTTELPGSALALVGAEQSTYALVRLPAGLVVFSLPR